MELMMKPYWKHISVPPKGLVLLAFIVGVALSGSNCNAQSDSIEAAQKLGSCVSPSRFSCASILGVATEDTSNLNDVERQDLPYCCAALVSQDEYTSYCICKQLKELSPEKTAALEKVCDKGEVAAARQQCEAKEKAAEAARQREEDLSKADACDRLFERLGANEASKISLEDARACRDEMKQCPASCQQQ